MGKVRPPYPPEFRQKMVDLVRAGRTTEQLAEEFEPSSISIRAWVKKANGELNPKPQDQEVDPRKELEQLRREVRILREEREILKKAAAWFAQETGTPSSRRSSS